MPPFLRELKPSGARIPIERRKPSERMRNRVERES
jgi:hypothetical protein